jgi:hypothetical protein
MATVNRILIAPPRAVLLAELAEAFATANRNQPRPGRLTWPPGDLDTRLGALAETAEGGHEWIGAGEYPAAVAAVWWTDFLGRKHVRLSGNDSTGTHKRPRPALLAPGRPALACVYPEHCLFSLVGAERRLLVLCGCGVWGEPAAVGWTGPCCAACHDRREAGEPIGPQPCGSWVLHPGLDGLAASPQGDVIATYGNGYVRLWDLTRGPRRLAEFPAPGAKCVAFSPDGSALAWEDLSSRVEVAILGGVQMAVEARGARVWSKRRFTFSADGADVIVHRPGTIDWVSVVTGDVTGSLPLDSDEEIGHLSLSPDGSWLAAAGNAETMRLWQRAPGGSMLPVTEAGVHRGFANWSPDGTRLAVQTRRSSVCVYERDQNGWRRQAVFEAMRVSPPRFTPDGQFLLAASTQGWVGAWDAATGQERNRTDCPGGSWRALDFTGGWVVIGAVQGTVRVLPVEMFTSGRNEKS